MSATIMLMRFEASEPSSDDVDTVLRIQRGEVAAFEMVFRRHYSKLLAFAQSYGELSADMAEDTICDVFEWLWRHRETWHPTTSVEAYLYGAVRNKLHNVVRNIRRDQDRRGRYTLWNESPGSAEPAPRADREIERMEIHDAVHRCVSELSPMHRMIVLLRWDKQWSWAEIAEALGISSAAAQMQHLRALKTLRTRLPEYFAQ